MTTTVCTHGDVKRGKLGTEERDGLEICLGCGLPTQESMLRMSAKAPPPEPAALVQAMEARRRGARFFEIQLEVGKSSRDVRFAEADSGSRTQRDLEDFIKVFESVPNPEPFMPPNAEQFTEMIQAMTAAQQGEERHMSPMS